MREPNPTKGLLSPKTPAHCRHCDVAMVVRARGSYPSHAHGGRGLCNHCYRMSRAGRKPGVPRRWRSLDLLEEYEFLLRQGLPHKPAVAERLGVKVKTLERAIVRGRAYRRRAAEQAAGGEAA